jgi:hypothetical protein
LSERAGEGAGHQHGPDVIKEVLESGEMPSKPHLLLHPEAHLSTEEMQTLIDEPSKSMQEE